MASKTCRSSRRRPYHAGEAEDLERIRIKGVQKVRGDYKCNFRYSYLFLGWNCEQMRHLVDWREDTRSQRGLQVRE